MSKFEVRSTKSNSRKALIANQTLADYSARLGIPTPNLETERRKGRARRYLGTCFWEENTVYVKVRGRPIRDIRRTVAHELVHHVFQQKPHGQAFQNYVRAVQRGKLVFDGRGLVQ